MRRDRPTIADIAHRAGVSIGTASNVFNQKGKFTAETRERVMRAAADLHYTPNALIRSLQRGRTNTIGVLFWGVPGEPEPGDIGTLLLKGISDGIAHAGYDMLLYVHHLRPDALPGSSLLDGRADGLILRPGGVSPHDLNAIADSGIPAVTVYEDPQTDGIGHVLIDNIGGVTAAMDHLISLGHRRIAFYAPEEPFDFVQRRKTYQDVLKRHGLVHRPDYQVTATHEYRVTISDACDRFLAAVPRPTAIVAGDDVAAYRFADELKRRGYSIPQDISLVGFNDTPVGGAAPLLTTVRQPVLEIGRMAAGFVTQMLEGKPARECRAEIPTQLVVRGTTGPPPTD
jgi:DNA-binding LacI/PurR family transcriptional regulator